MIKTDPCPECGHLLGEHRFGTARDDGCWATMLHPDKDLPWRGCGCRYKAQPHPDCLYDH